MTKSKTGLPLCFYPTTIISVDDDEGVLEGLFANFIGIARFKGFTNPLKAKDFLVDYKSPSFLNECFQSSDEGNFNEFKMSLSINKIHNHAFNPNRFSEISICIIDYAMPKMTGIQLCKSIKEKNFYKIILTGKADEKEAIQAFNSNLISQFYRKGEPKTYENILYKIRQLQINHFQKNSRSVLNSLNLERTIPKALLDPEIVKPFFNMIDSLQIAEYYLYNNDGYFLTVKYDGELNWLVIKSDQEINTLVNLLENFSEHTNTDESIKLVNQIKSKKVIPFLLDDKATNKPIDCLWPDFFSESKILKTKNNLYHYAFLKVDRQRFITKEINAFD